MWLQDKANLKGSNFQAAAKALSEYGVRSVDELEDLDMDDLKEMAAQDAPINKFTLKRLARALGLN